MITLIGDKRIHSAYQNKSITFAAKKPIINFSTNQKNQLPQILQDIFIKNPAITAETSDAITHNVIDLQEYAATIPIYKNFFKKLNGFHYLATNKKNMTAVEKRFLVDFMEKAQTLSYKDDLFKPLGIANDDCFYDLPVRFFIAAHNEARKTGSAVIIDKIPKVFQQIESKNLSQELDDLSLFLRLSKKELPAKVKIGNKVFDVDAIDGGVISSVYRIKSKNGESAVMKVYSQPHLIQSHGAFGEIPMYREMNKAGVDNTPELYMANPLYTEKETPWLTYSGNWALVEDIAGSTEKKSNGISLSDFLKQKELIYGDYNPGSTVGVYFVDLGGIYRQTNNPNIKSSKLDQNHFLNFLNSYKLGATSQGILEKLKTILS